MESVKLQARVGEDGILRLEVPLDVKNADLEVMVIVQRAQTSALPYTEWPEGYFDKTAGSLADDPIRR